MRFHTIMFKTLNDLFSFKRNLVFIALMIILPIIIAGIVNSIFDLTSMTLANQIQTVTMFYVIMVFFWVAGVPLILISSLTCGDFITKEESQGTLLLLVSKPVHRYEIIIGKYLGFLINIIILQIIGITLSALVMYWVLPVDQAVLDTFAGLIPAFIMYSLFVVLTFGALATALSSISKSRFKTIIGLVAITMGIFLGFIFFRGYMIGANVYDPYIVWEDVNYHMGNTYVSFLDSTGYKMTPPLQSVLGMFTGTYSAADPGKLYDQDIGAMYTSIPRTDYIHPSISMFGWLAFTFILLFIGIIRFQRREIQ